ncbi:quinone-dependent dihydroorotate dehydrogenase [Wohlfahrtiimonas chitiniclastica]|uniref:quinone-dependent dihydroorotate dehydrogenase n=1 Tax=Wohlfahrtiimonas chitiniclastica TaxID=400946 RepID=UPI001BCFCACB|nr:quinone-dependent dihydroorotate dehydrogenase [Wohlfahrtiimonas chitiniclastica]MBS7827905.1 quinone-dependent dihydroorotate dehydrogenase [Wohlfahrtiimonas chitiniclastica]
MMDFARRFLLTLPAETAHNIAIATLPLLPIATEMTHDPVTIMGLTFPNRLGLAAGLDKNGAALSAWAKMGFGFVEIGTVTPRPQPGNPKPRMFRIPEKQAIINRMGFNNKGIDHLLQNLAEYRLNHGANGPLIGVNIGKNAVTPIERATDDYMIGLQKAYALADYITINISSPNTKNLRALQGKDHLMQLLSTLKAEQGRLFNEKKKYTPLVVKLAPDMSEAELLESIEVIKAVALDGVIATNTTLSRDAVTGCINANEAGGLSGGPLTEKATEVVKVLTTHLPDSIPVIAAGGIMTGEDALDKIKAGAKLVQIYSGFIYGGTGLVADIQQKLSDYQS